MSANRADIRHTLAALLTNQVPLAQAVYAAEPGDIGGQSPVLVISSQASRREDLTFRGQSLTARVTIDVYVRLPDAATPGYTDADAADRLDDVEAQVAALVGNHPVLPPAWEACEFDGDTTIELGIWDGAPYFRERIPLAITVYG